MSRVTIVGLGGSLAPHSTSLSALRVALDGARPNGHPEHGARRHPRTGRDEIERPQDA